MARVTGGSASQVNGLIVPGQTRPVVPVLQRSDGSFVGYVETTAGGSMIAFDANGTLRWSVPAYDLPQIATADGGVIGRYGLIYDQNGNATGALDDLPPVQSWRGNSYVLADSLNQVVAAPLLFAQSLWAQAGGSPSRGGSAGRPWYFKLVWKNDCSTVAWPCGFTLYPDNPQIRTNLAIDATSQATVIKKAALDAFKRAFEKYPVNVTEGTANTGDNRVKVVDGYSFAAGSGNRCGVSSPFARSHDSTVYFLAHMEQAQWALPVTLNTSQDLQSAMSRREARWAYGLGSIGWEDVTANAWKSALGAGWHR